MHDGVYCEPHFSAAKGKSDYILSMPAMFTINSEPANGLCESNITMPIFTWSRKYIKHNK